MKDLHGCWGYGDCDELTKVNQLLASCPGEGRGKLMVMVSLKGLYCPYRTKRDHQRLSLKYRIVKIPETVGIGV